jgi:hypothetical protein
MLGIDHESDGEMLKPLASQGKDRAQDAKGKSDSFWI